MEKVSIKDLSRWKKEIIISAIIALAFTLYMTYYASHLEQKNLELYDSLTSFIGRYGDASTFLALAVGNTILPFPTDAYLASAMKLAERPLRVFVIGILGAFFGAIVNYYLAYFLRKAWVVKHVDQTTLDQAKFYFDKYGPSTLIVVAVLPLPLFDPVTFLAGISKMNMKDFLSFTFIAKIIHYVIWAGIPYGIL